MSYLGLLPIVFRTAGLFIFVPGFSHSVIPNSVKVFMSFSFALAFYPVLTSSMIVPTTAGEVLFLVVREVFFGSLIGFGCSITFESVSLAAHFIGLQVGLGTASLVDPQNQTQVSMVSSLFSLLCITLFFVTNAHHLVIASFVQSFSVTHKILLINSFSAGTLSYFMMMVGQLFWLSVQMALPVTLITLGTQLILGILGRMIPQMNLLLISFSITLVVGLMGIYIIAPEAIEWMELRFSEMNGLVIGFLKEV